MTNNGLHLNVEDEAHLNYINDLLFNNPREGGDLNEHGDDEDSDTEGEDKRK